MAESEVHHHHHYKDGADGEPEPKGAKRKMAQDGVGSPEKTPEGDVQIPKGALYRIAAAMKMDGADHDEGSVMEHLAKMAKEHAEFKSRLEKVEAEKTEAEAKRAKADVQRLVTLKVIAADEKAVAAALRHRKQDPDGFDTLYGAKLAGTERVAPVADDASVEARILLSQIAPNGGRARPTVNDAGDVPSGESAHARAVKIMSENKGLTYGGALTLASKQMKAESRASAGGR